MVDFIEAERFEYIAWLKANDVRFFTDDVAVLDSFPHELIWTEFYDGTNQYSYATDVASSETRGVTDPDPATGYFVMGKPRIGSSEGIYITTEREIPCVSCYIGEIDDGEDEGEYEERQEAASAECEACDGEGTEWIEYALDAELPYFETVVEAIASLDIDATHSAETAAESSEKVRAKFCESCGDDFSVDAKFCKSCGAKRS